MNTISIAILSKINSLAQKGRYIILSEEEISEAIEGQADGDAILKACKELSRDGYIDLKYAGGGMFCAAPLKDFEPEPVEPEIMEDEREVVVVKTGTAAAFFAALIGGAIGSIVASLILTVI